MEREPQLDDRVRSPDGAGTIVARSELNGAWYVRVKLDGSSERLWTGFAREVELTEASGEGELRRRLAGEDEKQ